MRRTYQNIILAGALAATLTGVEAQAGLTHRYNFNTDSAMNDSVGSAPGTLMNGAMVANGFLFLDSSYTDGNGARQVKSSSDSTGQYAALPGNVLAGAKTATIEFWMSPGFLGNPAGTWSRIFDFGTSVGGNGDNYICFVPHSGATPNDTRLAFRVAGNEIAIATPGTFDDGSEHHVACVFDATNNFLELYIDGQQRGRITCPYQLSSLSTNNMWIGRSQFGGDQYLYGLINEFRVYDRALSGAEAAANFMAGSETIGNNVSQLGAISKLYMTDPGSLVEHTSSNSVVTADFATANGVSMFNLSGLSLTSSDPTSVTISSAGVIKALKPTTSPVTLTATYGGQSATLSITVLPDQVAPTITGADSRGYDRLIEVSFSKPLDTASAQTVGNYQIDGGSVAVKSATLLTNGTTVRLITAAFDRSVSHTVVVSGVKDLSATPNVASGSTQFGPTAQTVIQKIWRTNVAKLGDMQGLAGFPYAPDSTAVLSSIETTGGLGEYYCDMIEGFIVPPTDGQYVFGISSDDESAFYLSTDSTVANLSQNYLCSLTSGWNSGSKKYHEQATQISAPVTLKANSKYYFRLLHRQGWGGDYMDLTWQTPGDPAIADGQGPIAGTYLLPYVDPSVAMSFSTQPTSQSIYRNQDATFTAAISARPAYTSFQWYRNGAAISGATNLSYTLPLAQATDSGSTFYAVASNLVDVVTSSIVNLTVTVDDVPPALVSAHATTANNQVLVSYSERVSGTTGTNKANYSIAGLTVLSAAFPDSTATNVLLTTSHEIGGNTYTVSVSNVKDLAGNTIAANSTAAFTTFMPANGFTYIRSWNGYNDNSDAGANAIYAWTLTRTPNDVVLVNTLSYGSRNMEYYCSVAEGYIVAPETGVYTFHVSSDDRSRFYLSTNDSPTGLQSTALAQVDGGWTDGPNNWDNVHAKVNSTVTLTAGQSYFYRLVYQQGFGGAFWNVGWELPSNPGTIVNVPSSAIGMFADPTLTSLSITQQPVNVTVMSGRKATFTAGATGSSAYGNTLTYQWQKNGVNIDGATGTSYTTPYLPASDNNAKFKCVVSIPGKTVVSDVATLTVNQDSVAPAIVSAGALNGGTIVGIRFAELIDPASVTTATYTIPNYQVLNVQFRTNATLDGINGDLVQLTVDQPITDGLTVKVVGVKDLSGNATTTATAPIGVSDLTAVDIGTPGVDPVFAGVTIPTGTNSFEFLAGGTDIWETHDGCHFVYKQMTGDFDVRLRAASLFYTSNWAKFGLMVRESLDATSRDLSIVADPTPGANVVECNYRNVANSATANWPGDSARTAPTYPNMWLRITCVANVYTAYRSTDGVTWTQLAQIDNSTAAYANNYVGICICSHDNSSANRFTVADGYDFSLGAYVPPPATPPTITAAIVGSNVVLSWDATLGAGYGLVNADDVAATTWNADSSTVVNDGSTCKVTISANAAKKFYRLKK